MGNRYDVIADQEETEELLASGYKLRREIRRMEERIKDINSKIAKKAIFADDCNTGYLSGGNFRAKVCKRTNVRWDQDKLRSLRDRWGSDLFFSVFRVKLEPIPNETQRLTAEQSAEAALAKTEKEGAPSVEVEYLGEIV